MHCSRPKKRLVWALQIANSACGVLQNGLVGGIVLRSCTGVTLHGPATLTYIQSQFPFAQGTVLSVNRATLQYTIKVSHDSTCMQV